MKTIRFRLLVAALAVMFAAAVAHAQTASAPADAPADFPPAHHHFHPMMGPEGHGWEFHGLDLTDAQKSQMKDIMTKEKPTMKPLMQQMHTIHQQLRQYEQGNYDEAKVRALAAQQTQTMTEMTVQQTRIHSEMYQLLTPDQQAKMKERQAQREAHMQKHMGDGPPAEPQQ
jgi:protein CpxP